MKKIKKQSAFTIVELLVAMGLLAVIMTTSGFIFHVAIKSQRTAKATLEITQKLQTITTQLDADFKKLRKDGLIFAVWMASPLTDSDGLPLVDINGVYDGYERFDRLMFFVNGNYQTYNEYDHDNNLTTPPETLTGNVARITYMLANYDRRTSSSDPDYSAYSQRPHERSLARSQHIQIKDPDLGPFPNFGSIPVLGGVGTADNDNYIQWHNYDYEYDNALLADWKNALLSELVEMLTIATDIRFGSSDKTEGGLIVSPDDMKTIHMLLCEGVGSFSVQSWYDAEQRWIPEIDPDGNGDLTNDSDFFLDGQNIDLSSIPGFLYPFMPSTFGETSTIGILQTDGTNNWREYAGPFNEPDFNNIPGLGRAFRFTFTLYDSMGIFPDGKTFTHIVYLDD